MRSMKTSFQTLDDLGILGVASLPTTYSWLDDDDKQLLVDLLMAGEDGFGRVEVRKRERRTPNSILKVVANSCADWQTDRTGKPERLVLTYRGEEVAQLLMKIARNRSQLEAQGLPLPE